MPSLAERSEEKRYLKMKRRKRRMRITVVITIPLVIIACVLFYVFFQANRTYSAYSVVAETEKIEGNDVKYMMYGDKLLKYSKDGASAMEMDGTSVWNGSYDFENPFAVANGDYVAIADIGARTINVYDGSATPTTIETDAAVEQIVIGKQGVVAAILEQNDRAKINIYDPYDAKERLKVSIATSTDSDGYPVAIAISDDAQKLVTSYINITNGVISTSLNFYNFDSVGQNSVDRIVGSRPMGEEIVADVQFLNNTDVCAFTEKGVRLYKFSQTPADIADIEEKESIKSVDYNEDYIAMVLDNPSNLDKPYLAKVYDTDGKLVLEKEVDYRYNEFELGSKELIFYSSTECHIVRFRGSEKFDCDFESPVSYFFPIEDSGKYCLIDGGKINQIKLEGRKKEE